MSKNEAEAEEFEKKAKEEQKRKNYELAMDFFKKAKNIYSDINYVGKVGVIDNQIAQLKRAIEYEQRAKGKDKGKVDKKPDNVKVKPQYTRDALLSEAENRRMKLRENLELKEKQANIKHSSDAKIEERMILKNQEEIKKQTELNVKTQKDIENKTILVMAENLLDSARKALKSNDFILAKNEYTKAVDIFKSLGWYAQVDILYQEIKNIELYKTEYLRNQKDKVSLETSKEVEFQKQINLVLEEKKKREEILAARLNKLPNEIKKVMQKTKMLGDKAEKELQSNMSYRALDRYHYILELYQSIPNDTLDLSYEIAEIKKKIKELEPKM